MHDSILYYTNSRKPRPILDGCYDHLQATAAGLGMPIVAVCDVAPRAKALTPTTWLPFDSSGKTVEKSILGKIIAGATHIAETAGPETMVHLCDDDTLHPPRHFIERPRWHTGLAYNTNVVYVSAGGVFDTFERNSLTNGGLSCQAGIMVAAFSALLADFKGGWEPVENAISWHSSCPWVDIRHSNTTWKLEIDASGQPYQTGYPGRGRWVDVATEHPALAGRADHQEPAALFGCAESAQIDDRRTAAVLRPMLLWI